MAGLFLRKSEGEPEFFICRRPPYKSNPLLWEFVGGKVEAGETPQEALVRECKEEMDANIAVGEIYTEVDHEYEDIFIHLTLYFAELLEEPKLLEHVAFAWIKPSQIKNYAFCPADKQILAKILCDFGTVR
ncbi:MAG: (deoxy)nucleoside triphosphate pyrophosphohydrolase [Clostridia bacterium]|nr:(deoxy)nucleoside triphosphate pyrophosphohydrolase [Clostridia bacterium]